MNTTTTNQDQLKRQALISIAQGDDKAKARRAQNDLLAMDANLITYYAKVMLQKRSLYYTLVELQDLEQEARAGYLRAVELYDPSLNVPLKNYAYTWMRAKTQRYMENHSRTIRLSQSFVQRMREVAALEREYQELGLPVTDEVLMNLFKNPRDLVTFKKVRATSAEYTKDLDWKNSDGFEAHEYIASSQSDPEALATQASLSEKLKEALEQLSPTELASLVGTSPHLLEDLGIEVDPELVAPLRTHPKGKAARKLHALLAKSELKPEDFYTD